MQPEAFQCGNWSLHWSAIIWPAVLFVLWGHWHTMGRTRGWPHSAATAVALLAVTGIIIGARSAFVLTDPLYYFKHPVAIFDLSSGGLVFFGGLLGGLTGAFMAAGRYNLSPAAFIDTLITPVPLAHAMGRIGCFLNGCCFGAAYEGFTGVTYPAGSPAWIRQVYGQAITRFDPRSLPVHPVQLYEAAANLLLYLVLFMLWRKRLPAGRVAACYAVGYGGIRFLAEFLRGDSRIILAGLHLSQIFSLIMILFGIWLWKRSRTNRQGFALS